MLGARWDPQGKLWYIPEGKEAAPFARWLPKQGDVGLAMSRDSRSVRLSSALHSDQATGG
nr:DUF5710 domain-containing protein [Stutzerimonas nitrititolerans]